jgi:ABC-type spermidine/putrescine transport system permease subunit I
MIELILILITLSLVGTLIYFFRYRNKEKPKVGVKRNNYSEYFKDYIELKLYWGSISLIVIGIVGLLAIGIIEMIFMYV